MNTISLIKNSCRPNPQGISRISLLAADTLEYFEYPHFVFKPGTGPRVTFFQLGRNTGFWSYSWAEDFPGVSYVHDLTIETPAGALDIEDWLRKNATTRFLAYIVLNSGQVYLLGSPDQPFRLTGFRSVSGLNQFILTFSCHATDFPEPLFSQAVPHFLTIP